MPPLPALVERFQLSVLPGADIETAASALIHELTTPTPPGFICGSWGTVIEDPDRVEFWLTWDNLASHVSFSTQAKVAAITQILVPIAACMPVVYHVAFTSEFRVPAAYVVGEILSITPAPKEIQIPNEGRDGYLGHVQGKVAEKVEGSRVYVVVVWWEDHDGLGAQRRIDGLRSNGARKESCHIRFRPF